MISKFLRAPMTITLMSLVVFFHAGWALAYPPAQLKHSFEFTLDKVLLYKKMTPNPQIKPPTVLLASRTPLKQFQDAIEPQWGFRPKAITNAYVFAKNEIYLFDDRTYYEQNHRCMDDSLAHELTHFVQLKYQQFDMSDESLEWDAIDLQSWFRENYCR